jgi:hypothetical protein
LLGKQEALRFLLQINTSRERSKLLAFLGGLARKRDKVWFQKQRRAPLMLQALLL